MIAKQYFEIEAGTDFEKNQGLPPFQTIAPCSL